MWVRPSGGGGNAATGGAGAANEPALSGVFKTTQPMIAIEMFNNLYECLDGFQVAALDRDVGKAQRLGEPCDLQMDVSLRRVEPARRDDRVDFALDRPNADLASLRDLLGAEAGGEQVERGPAKRGLRAPAGACGGSRPGACGLGVFGHDGSIGE